MSHRVIPLSFHHWILPPYAEISLLTIIIFSLSETAPLAYGAPALDPPPKQQEQHGPGLCDSSTLTAAACFNLEEKEKNSSGVETLAVVVTAAVASKCFIADTAEVICHIYGVSLVVSYWMLVPIGLWQALVH
jgi:hypothetical protein